MTIIQAIKVIFSDGLGRTKTRYFSSLGFANLVIKAETDWEHHEIETIQIEQFEEASHES